MFEINGDARVIAFKDIKGRSAIIIDDFYRDPDEVRELALSLEYTEDPDRIAGFPGKRGYLDTTEVKDKLYNLFLDLCNNKLWKQKEQKTQLLEDGSFKIPLPSKIRPFNLDDFNISWSEQAFMVNCTNDSLIVKNPLAEIPHQDYWEKDTEEEYRFQFGSVIFLNTPDECAGGTNLYSYNGQMSIPSNKEGIQNLKDQYDFDVSLGPVLTSMSDDYKFKYIKDKVNSKDRNNPFKVEFEAEMKYNRMFLYQSDVLHKGEIDLGMFTDYDRINQVFFL